MLNGDKTNFSLSYSTRCHKVTSPRLMATTEHKEAKQWIWSTIPKVHYSKSPLFI